MMQNRHAQNSAMRLGIALNGQMEGYIRWTKTPGFTLGRLHKVPKDVELIDELIDEFVRFSVAGYVDGVFSTVRPDGSLPFAALSSKALRGIENSGARLGAAALHHVRTIIMPILEMSFAYNTGTRIKSNEQIEKEIRAAYAPMLRVAPVAWRERVLELAEAALDPVDQARDRIIDRSVKRARTRRMKVRNRADYEKWQKTHKPFSKWIKQSAAQLRAEAIAPPTISPEYAVRWVQTERTKFFNQGVLAATNPQWNVIGYVFRAQDGGHSEICQAMDGLQVSKGDPRLDQYTAPLHHGCQSYWEPIYASDEMPTFARKRDFPDPSLIAKGFGQTIAKPATKKLAPRYHTKRKSA